jgi:hypothetical protein
MEMSGQFHAPAALLPGKEPLVPLDRSLDGPRRRSERGGEEKNSQPLPGLEPPIIQPVAQRCTAELSRARISIYSVYELVSVSHPLKATLLFHHVQRGVKCLIK